MPLTTSTVKYEVRDRVAWVTLNRPEAMNALNQEIRHGIGEAMKMASGDDNVLVVIMTGEGGRAFSAGADLKEANARNLGRSVPGAQWTYSGFQEVTDCPKPIIAAIDGYCLAGGLQTATRCDIRIATQKSRFGMPEPRRSLTPILTVDTMEGGFASLGEAMWIILTGSHMTAERAYQIGLIQALVPDRAALFEHANWLAGEIKQCAPLALRALKLGAQLRQNPPIAPGGPRLLDHLRPLNQANQDRVANSEDRLEGPRAFAEKRQANWKNR